MCKWPFYEPFRSYFFVGIPQHLAKASQYNNHHHVVAAFAFEAGVALSASATTSSSTLKSLELRRFSVSSQSFASGCSSESRVSHPLTWPRGRHVTCPRSQSDSDRRIKSDSSDGLIMNSWLKFFNLMSKYHEFLCCTMGHFPVVKSFWKYNY